MTQNFSRAFYFSSIILQASQTLSYYGIIVVLEVLEFSFMWTDTQHHILYVHLSHWGTFQQVYDMNKSQWKCEL